MYGLILDQSLFVSRKLQLTA